MEENGLVIFKSPNSKCSSAAALSPGNNPFDDLWKRTMDIVSISEQVNRRSSFRLSTDFAIHNRESFSFCDLNVSDFGRESMGILPPDFGRDSLGFMNGETDRESLGIIQINALRESLSFRRESLGILNLQDLCRESLEGGKESLGILHLKSPDVKFGDEDKRIPDIMLTTIDENSSVPSNVLDTAFLQPHSRRSSTLSSISSINPSFNSLSLEGPSRIYSVSSLRNFKDASGNTDFNNMTYSTSSIMSSINSPLNKAKIFSPSELNSKSRIQSGPASSNKFSPLLELELEDGNERFWSTGRTTYANTLERRSFHGVLDFNEADISNDFHDSVFIEGHILAEKIADGSILNDSSVGEVGVLDCTPQPDWPNDLSYNDPKENECQKCDTETVFKTVDKMLPPSTQDILNIKLKTSKTDSNSSNENEEKVNINEQNRSKHIDEQNVSKLIHNLSDIQHESKNNSASRKDPKEILNNLSELLSCTNVSDKQKSQGQNMLNSLADMLCEGKSNLRNNLDDSGHSSINEHLDSPNKERHECFEVLDLRLKATDEQVSNENCYDKNGVLDLSLKLKPVENLIESRLSRSLCSSNPNVTPASQAEKKNASSSSLDLNKNKTTNSSLASNDSKNSSNLTKSQISGRLRQKHFSNLKKGPMKAVIPVGDMKKKSNVPVTPEKDERKTSNMQSKRTSTPINEPKLKPMAASTPTTRSTNGTRSSKELGSNGNSAVKSKINSSNSFTRDRAYSTTGLPRPSTINAGLKLRRNSVSDVKKPNEGIRRRNSVESENGIMSSVIRARKNLASSPSCLSQKPHSGVESKPLTESNSKFGGNRHLPDTKSNNLEIESNAAIKVTPKKINQTGIRIQSQPNPIPSSQQRPNRFSTSSPSQLKNKIQGRYERRSSSREVVRNKETDVKINKRNSVGSESGMMSSLAKVRQNILDSPYFNVNKEVAINKNYIVLSDNRVQKNVTQLSKSRKTGKENTEK